MALHFLLFPYFPSLFLLLEQIMEKCITKNNHRTLGSCIKGLCFNIGSFVGGLWNPISFCYFIIFKKKSSTFHKRKSFVLKNRLSIFPLWQYFSKRHCKAHQSLSFGFLSFRIFSVTFSLVKNGCKVISTILEITSNSLIARVVTRFQNRYGAQRH